MNRLANKVALITGASKGIGKGIAAAFAAEGASLILAARSSELLNQLADSLKPTNAEILSVVADVTDEAQVVELFQQAQARFNRLDLLINNAGVFDGGPLEQLSLATWEKVMAVNLRGPFLCTREAFKIMKPQGVGRIINVGSISAQRVRPYSAPYSTSKHGLWGLTQVTALEGREYGITCGCIHPGNVAVETLAESRRQSGEPVMRIEEWVDAIVAMAGMPPHINVLESIVLPMSQLYVGRG